MELRRRTGVRLSDIGPMRAAPREMLLELGPQDRRSGWPLEMVLQALLRCWRVREVASSYLRRAGRSKVTATERDGACRRRHGQGAPLSALLVIARAPRPGHSKTRLCPPCTLEQAAGLAEAALKDTLEAVAATVVERRVLVLDDSPARWVPEASRSFLEETWTSVDG